MRKRGDRRRAARQAAGEVAADVVITPPTVFLGQAIWYVGTYPLRLLARALGPL